MFVHTVKSEGLAHLSYVVGSDGVAAVIDPRRDICRYIELAAAESCRITHILETHRNEDLVSGASALAERTGAVVLHGPNSAAEVVYARTAREGDVIELGDARLVVIETPGHTDDSLSFALYASGSDEDALGVFSGDALFVGDVGRTDFYPDRPREVAGNLFDSLRKLEALGDQAILYPAHGAGSVCGGAMADRDVSTIGHERVHNPRLRIADRDAFIEAKLAEHHDQPPYFRFMERLNLSGAPALRPPLQPPPLRQEDFAARAREAVVVDVRSASAFLGAHLRGSLSLPVGMIGGFAGWLLSFDDELLLVAEDGDQAATAARRLARMGFDRVHGYLAPSLTAWAAAGCAFGSLVVVGAETVHSRTRAAAAGWHLLDVRSPSEVEALRIEAARNIYLGELPERLSSLDPTQSFTVMCGSGTRATIAASILLRAGFERVDLFLGSIGAWRSRGFATAGSA
jgi:hydroxyacylglutathione hydrolase